MTGPAPGPTAPPAAGSAPGPRSGPRPAAAVVAGAQGHRAGVVTRGVALAVDFVGVLVAYPVVVWGVGFAIGLLRFETPEYPDLDPGVSGAVQAAILFTWFVGAWLVGGRTLGQALLGLRVVDRGGGRVRAWQAVVRWWVLFATLFVVGPMWLALSGERLALHDRASRTQVLYDRSPRRARVRVVPPGTSPAPVGSPAPAQAPAAAPGPA